MPATIEALTVVVIALLPGALYTWAFEREVGRWGAGFSDRLLRFVGISALFHALAAPVSYALWRDYLREEANPGLNDLPLWLWPVVLLYVAVPFGFGAFLAYGYKHDWKGFRAALGASAPPTAWDALFFNEPAGWVLLKTKSGTWLGGEYAQGSYAGGYPEPADLFLSRQCHIDQSLGDFYRDHEGEPVATGFGLLVRWSDVEYLEVTPTEAE